MGCRVVCISQAEGAGGAQVGHLVADKLGFRYVDEEIVARAAAKGGISPRDVADEERRKTLLSRLLQEMGGCRGRRLRIFGYRRACCGGPSADEIRGMIQEAIDETAGQGDVVIVAHAASRALSSQPDVLRVLVTASPETRARRLSESHGIEPKEAKKSIKEADAARADYFRRFYGDATERPTHYDIVINTDVLSIEQSASS